MAGKKDDCKDWAQEIIAWAQTKEGQDKLAAANENSNIAVCELRKSFVIDDEVLNTSFH